MENNDDDDAMEIEETTEDTQIIVRDHGEEKIISGGSANVSMESITDPDPVPGPSSDSTEQDVEMCEAKQSEPPKQSEPKQNDDDVVFKAPLPPGEPLQCGTFKEPYPPKPAPPAKITTTSDPVDVVILDDDDDEDEEDAVPVVVMTPKKSKNGDSPGSTGSVEVIDLVEKSANSKCINYSCKSGLDLITAPNFCLSYYRVKKMGSGKKEVCNECYEIAIREYDMLVTKLKNGEVLCSVEVPIRNDTVEIEDSDEEDADSDDGAYFDDEALTFLEENFERVLSETLEKFHVKEQVIKEIDYLKGSCKKIKEDVGNIQNGTKDTRKRLDNYQVTLYNKFRMETVSTGTVIIVDDPSINPPPRAMPLSKPPPLVPTNAYYQRKSQRAVGKKQVPYIEPLKQPAGLAKKHYGIASPRTIPLGPPKQPPALVATPITAPAGLSTQGRSKEFAPRDVPVPGIPEKPIFITDEIYYISRENSSGSWIRARFKNTIPAGTVVQGKTVTCPMYKVVELKQHKERLVDGKNIASMKSSKIRFDVGTRVIAVFKEISSTGEIRKVRTDPYYPGIVGEPPVAQNNYRYLIFFDIGYSQYVHYSNVHMVYEASKNVWEDMHVTSRSFIKKYLESTDRPMVKLATGQTIRTEYNGKWVLCTIMDVDCSLVLVFFDSLNRMEWIYRGSTRLSPMFKEEQNANKRHAGGRTSGTRKNPNESATIVQYTKNTDFEKLPGEEGGGAAPPAASAQVQVAPTRAAGRSVARKSTARPEVPVTGNKGNYVPFLPPVNNASNNGVVPMEPTSKIMYFTPRDQIITHRLFRQHNCSPGCKDYVRHSLGKLRGHNPLSKPLLCGWARITMKVKGRKEIVYKAPCSRILRDMDELHRYLRATKSDMTVDLFDFNHMVRCLAEFNVECVPDPKDLSRGLEQVPVPVINGINNEMLEFCNYGTKRVPMDDVPLNTDPEFLCGCDCEDDCADKMKCTCWQMTLEGAKWMGKNVKPETIGYVYRRLHEQVLTGIYECNSRCKCASTCLNRVVQNPMSIKLQVFRTHNRGWGIRCVNDVPQGTFICIYAGTIHTEQMANEDGQTYGDEYFAELDYIENCERHKEDYEEDAIEPDSPTSTRRSSSPENEDDDDDEEEEETQKTKYRRRHKLMEDNDFVPSCPTGRIFPEHGAMGDKSLRLRKRKEEDKSQLQDSGRKRAIKKEDHRDVDRVTSEIETVTISDDEDDPKEVLSFNPKNSSELDQEAKPEQQSVRTFFGEEEPYIMDTKNAGNIGRFLNHSCSPNVFVQNVFVDTHDLRFPWVAFFCSQFIRAGTELTWNYNYDIGSVPGRVLYCHCGSLECKGRLL